MLRVKENDENTLMLKLAYSSYSYLKGNKNEEMKKTVGEFLKNWNVTNQEIVWGGVARDEDLFGFNTALIYVVKNLDNPNEYSVVVRGTNPFSFFKSWYKQDLEVANKILWSRQSPESPARKAKISEAAHNSMIIHKKIKDNGINLIEFLTELLKNKDVIINFTGHSLGGLIAPLFALLLYEKMENEIVESHSFSIYSFAGPTAGDKDFAERMEEVFSKEVFKKHKFFRWYHDVAVNVWDKDEMGAIFRFYNYWPINTPITAIVKSALEDLISKVDNNGYTQPFKDGYHEIEFEVGMMGKLFTIPALKDLETIVEIKDDIVSFFKKHTTPRTTTEEVLHTLVWIFWAGVMHVAPYALVLLEKEEAEHVKEKIIKPLFYSIIPNEQIKGFLEGV